VRFAGDAAARAQVGEPFLWPFLIGSALYRRSIFERVGRFDPSLRFGEDADWFQRATERGLRMVALDAVTLLYRQHADSMTSQARSAAPHDLGMLAVVRRKLERRIADG
jgi:hypothetical protein